MLKFDTIDVQKPWFVCHTVGISKTKSYCPKKLIGSNIKVLWPADKKYFEGVVMDYDTERKLMILYDGGDVEILILEREDWHLVRDVSAADQGLMRDGECSDETSEMPKRKKAKISVDLASKQLPTYSAPPKGDASFSKFKSVDIGSKQWPIYNAPQEGGASFIKFKIIPKRDKSKEDSYKSVSKSAEDKWEKSKVLKCGNKSSYDIPITVGKSKGDNRATEKSKSPNSACKSNTNGIGTVNVGPSPKAEEEEDAEISHEPAAKAPENPKRKSPSATQFQKSGKKRKMGAKS